MEQNQVTAVCFHFVDKKWQGNGIMPFVEYAGSYKNVKKVWINSDTLSLNREKIVHDIADYAISRIVIFGPSANNIKAFFTQFILKEVAKKPEIIPYDFTDFGIKGVHKAELFRKLIKFALSDFKKVFREQDTQKLKSEETLVIGAGIAGIQAALEIANSGYKVHLVEKSGTIGGHMAMFDKTFPTLDCAACILTPKMVEIGQHKNIEVYTLSEVIQVDGEIGDFKVTLLNKARRVDLDKCTGCGTCSDKCPGRAYSEFDSETTLRKAIYMPFPQAVPNKYLVDPGSCLYVQKGKCRACVKACPVENCINLDEQDKNCTLHVGNIIVATGFKTFNASKIERYGYGKFPNVITSIELERLVNASGPTDGNITYRIQNNKGDRIFTNEGDSPHKFAIIHCIGSRDEKHHRYCSRVCCMYSLKLAHLIKEKLPHSVIYEHYIDMRAFGKGYEEFYSRIRGEGIKLIRGKTARVEKRGDMLFIRSEDIERGVIIENQVDMVVLSVGLEPNLDNELLAKILDVEISQEGWFNEKGSLSTYETNRPGIYMAGACQAPKDIPDTVVQAAAAASAVIKSIIRGNILTEKELPDYEFYESEAEIQNSTF